MMKKQARARGKHRLEAGRVPLRQTLPAAPRIAAKGGFLGANHIPTAGCHIAAKGGSGAPFPVAASAGPIARHVLNTREYIPTASCNCRRGIRSPTKACCVGKPTV